MKETREELLVKLAETQQNLTVSRQKDWDARKEFAKALGMFKRNQYLGLSSQELEVREVTWAEIYVEIGKLLAIRDFRDFEGNLSELEMKVREIEKSFLQDKEPGNYEP